MTIRAFRPEDASALVAVAKSCARGETDFVLVPLWESERDLFAEFERHGVGRIEFQQQGRQLEGPPPVG